NNSVEAVIAADSAVAPTDPLPSYDNLAARMTVPMPDAGDVKQAQDVAMADTEIPALDPNPQISALVADSRSASVLASADPAMAEIRTQLVKPVKEQADQK